MYFKNTTNDSTSEVRSPDYTKIDTIRPPPEDEFSIVDISGTIESYELLLHTHSARVLKRSFLSLQSVVLPSENGWSPPPWTNRKT